MFERLFLHLLTGLDKSHRRHRLQLIAEVIAHRRLQNFVDEILHRTDHRNDAWRFGIRHMNLHLQVDLKHEPSQLFAMI